MAEAVLRRRLAAEAWVQSQINTCDICVTSKGKAIPLQARYGPEGG